MQGEIRKILDEHLTLDDVVSPSHEFYKMETYRRVGLEEQIHRLIILEKEKVLMSMLSLIREAWGMK